MIYRNPCRNKIQKRFAETICRLFCRNDTDADRRAVFGAEAGAERKKAQLQIDMQKRISENGTDAVRRAVFYTVSRAVFGAEIKCRNDCRNKKMAQMQNDFAEIMQKRDERVKITHGLLRFVSKRCEFGWSRYKNAPMQKSFAEINVEMVCRKENGRDAEIRAEVKYSPMLCFCADREGGNLVTEIQVIGGEHKFSNANAFAETRAEMICRNRSKIKMRVCRNICRNDRLATGGEQTD